MATVLRFGVGGVLATVLRFLDFDADLRLDLDLPLSERTFLDFDTDLRLDLDLPLSERTFLDFDTDLRLDLDLPLSERTFFDFDSAFDITFAPFDGYITVRCDGPVLTAAAVFVSAIKNPPLFFLPTANAGILAPVGFPELSTIL